MVSKVKYNNYYLLIIKKKYFVLDYDLKTNYSIIYLCVDHS